MNDSPLKQNATAALRRSLQDSEDRFQLFVESVADYAMFMLTPDGRVDTWNVGAQRIKGYSADEIIGRHFSTFYPEEDVRSGKCEHELEVAAAVGRFEDEGWRVRKDGTRFWANVIISAVRNADGDLVGYSKVTRDLTERRRAEEERLRLAQAEEALRLRDEFLSIASHELKTPLTSLRLQLQSLRDGADVLVPRVARKLERALRSTERLTRLVETLLDVSRMSTGRLTLNKEPFDLVEATEEVCDRFREQAEQARTEIVLRAEARPILGVWDRLRVEQVVSNLIANALKYAPGQPVSVVVSAIDGEASISVADRGPGIPEAAAPRIFERFERAAPVVNYGGLGLGLFVSREIVNAHGGAIGVCNRPEGGACFTLSLPLDRLSQPKPPRAREVTP